MNLSKENEKILKPTEEPLEMEGKMSYAESQRAWGTIRLKSEIFNEFKKFAAARNLPSLVGR